MSTNCVRCVKNERSGFDMLCEDCRKVEHRHCEYYKDDPEEFTYCPVGNRGVIMEPASYCYDCPHYKEKIKAYL